MDYLFTESRLIRMCDPDNTDRKFGVHTYGNLHEQVMRDHILPHINCNILIKHLSDVYVLFGQKKEEIWCKKGEKKWLDILGEERYNAMTDYVILSMVLITQRQDYVDIELIDNMLEDIISAFILWRDWRNFLVTKKFVFLVT